MTKYINEEDGDNKFYEQFDEEMNNYYMEYMTKKQRAMLNQQEAARNEMLARGIDKGITDIWFGQQEFNQKTKDDDEFAD